MIFAFLSPLKHKWCSSYEKHFFIICGLMSSVSHWHLSPKSSRTQPVDSKSPSIIYGKDFSAEALASLLRAYYPKTQGFLLVAQLFSAAGPGWPSDRSCSRRAGHALFHLPLASPRDRGGSPRVVLHLRNMFQSPLTLVISARSCPTQQETREQE